MKKQLLLFVMFLLPMMASADDSGSCGDNVTYTYIEDTKTLIISGTGGINNFYIGNAPWDSYKTRIQTLIIESGVISIGNNAFWGCSGLTSVTVSNSVTSIGYTAFANCSGLDFIMVESGNPKYDSRNNCNAIIETATNTLLLGCKKTIIPNDVTSIGYGAFYGCSMLTSISVPSSVTSIGNHAFYKCNGLTSIIIPNNVTSIGNSAFYECSGLTSIIIPNSVTSIGESAFYKCSGLTSVTIGNSVTSISNYAFYLCSGLTSITIPNSVISIGNYAFWYCSRLTSVAIGNSVTDIGSHAFAFCSDLTLVSIPNSVTSISDCAFRGCSNLTSVTIPNSVTTIGDGGFSNCSSLTSVTIPNSVTEIGESAFNGCNNLSTLTLPEDINIIKKGTFLNCAIKSIVIPAKVEYIYAGAFACNGTQEVKVLAKKPPFAYDNSFNNYNIPLYVPTESVTDYQITNPWSKFSTLKTLESDLKCKTPTISYSKGKLTFNCETEGVEYKTSITDTDIKDYTGSSIQLSVTYTVKVYAVKSGYQNSDIATATLCWIDVEPKTEGITTGTSQIPAKAVLIQSDGGLLTIQGADDGTKIGVYTINGTLAGEGISRNGCATVNTNIQPGSVAIIKVGDRSVKVVVK